MISPEDFLETAHAMLPVIKDAASSAKKAHSLFKFADELYQIILDRKYEVSRKLITAVMNDLRKGVLTPEEVQAEFQELFARPFEERSQIIKILSLSYKTLLECVDERILLVLSRLTSMYLEKITMHRRKEIKDTDIHLAVAIDGFFRSTCRLLMDLSYDEYCALRSLVCSTNEYLMNSDYEECEMLKIMRYDEKLILVNHARGQSMHEFQFDKLEGDLTHSLRIFSLLKVHALASESPSGGFGSSSGPFEISIEQAIIKKLNLLFA